MKSNTLRILRDSWSGKSVRQHYWALSTMLGRLKPLLVSHNRTFRRHLLRDARKFVTGSSVPVSGETRERARAAANWLARAQDATPDGGVSYGYFPCETQAGWHASYPETTGYIIPTFLDYARYEGDNSFLERAMRMADWEVEIQMPSGAVQGGRVCEPARQTPASFNTGTVLQGWTRILETGDFPEIGEAAYRAASFLVSDLDENGIFRTAGEYVSSGEVKIYQSLCGWPLYALGKLLDNDSFKNAAIMAAEAAVRARRNNGWFENNCLVRSEAPLTHTLGYTLQAIVEIGILAGREDMMQAARGTIDEVVPLVSENGYLKGRFYSDWSPAVFSSCLTGSAQLAIVMYRIAMHCGEERYIEPADRIVNFLKAVQEVDSGNDGINGALAGSFPIAGQYMTLGYPNWATKYFLDALMQQDAAHNL